MVLAQLFFPANKKFFSLFDDLAARLQGMIAVYSTSMNTDNSRLPKQIEEMAALHRSTEQLVDTLFDELSRNLITPFYREDMHFLAIGIHSISRNIFHLIKQLRNYGIEHRDETMKIVARQNVQAIELLAHVLKSLKDLKDPAMLNTECAGIKRLLQDCDDLLDHSVAIILNDNEHTFHLIKMIDHYEGLQKLLEKVGDTINVCESIIIKYA